MSFRGFGGWYVENTDAIDSIEWVHSFIDGEERMVKLKPTTKTTTKCVCGKTIKHNPTSVLDRYKRKKHLCSNCAYIYKVFSSNKIYNNNTGTIERIYDCIFLNRAKGKKWKVVVHPLKDWKGGPELKCDFCEKRIRKTYMSIDRGYRVCCVECLELLQFMLREDASKNQTALREVYYLLLNTRI